MIKCCPDNDMLHYKLMRSKEFMPHHVAGRELDISEHIRTCPVCISIASELLKSP